MKRFRVSIAGMMAGIIYLGMAFAALKKPTPLWAESWLTATLAVLGVAVLGAIYAGRCRRPFWGGFAIVGGGFMAFGLLPALAPRLVTHRLIDWHYRTMPYSPTGSEEAVWVKWNDKYHEGHYGGPGVITFLTPSGTISGGGLMAPGSLKPISPESHHQLCHSILAPLLGLAGGLVARTFAARARQERNLLPEDVRPDATLRERATRPSDS